MAAIRMTLELRYEGREGTTLEFEEERLEVGRVEGKLKINDSQASSRHFALFARDGGLWIEDLGSRNGTTLNEEPLASQKPREVHPGDTIGLGAHTRITVLKAAPVSADPSSPVESILETGRHDTPTAMPRFDLVGGGPAPEPSAPSEMAAEGVWAASKDSIPPRPHPGSVIPEGSITGALHVLKEASLLYRTNILLFLAIAAVLYLPAAVVSGCSYSMFFAPVRQAEVQAETSAKRLSEIAKLVGRQGAVKDRALVELQAETLRNTGAVMSSFIATVLQLLVTMIIVLFVFGLAQPLTQGAMIYAVAARKKQQRIAWREAWLKVMPAGAPLVLTSLLVGLLVGVGTLFLVVPGVLIGFLCAFVPQVVLLEKLQLLAAIKRSIQLVTSDWVRVAVVLIVLLVIQYLSSLAAGAVFSNTTFAYGFANTLLSMLAIPFPVTAGVLLYFDLRLKRDGVDCLQRL